MMPDKMNKEQFARLKALINSQSPIGFEGAMTHGFLAEEFAKFAPKSWTVHRFKGNAGIIFDSNPKAKNALTVMLVGHADKIRLQVKSIGSDGKIWVDSDSFLPCTLIGHEVTLYSQGPKTNKYRAIKGGTIEAIGAIHFANPKLRSGDMGIKANQLYLELQMYGKDPAKKLAELGIAPGDPILLQRPIKQGFAPNTITGAYLDNGLGCFVTEEIARIFSEQALKNIRLLFAFAPFEEIGRFGSRVFAHELNPDILLAIDVTHDYKAAPNIGDQHFPATTIGGGAALVTGAITSPHLNLIMRKIAKDNELAIQIQGAGRDTGTDAMAPFLASTDSAALSIGIPVRNMHTISEVAHTGDIMSAINLIQLFIEHLEENKITSSDIANGHIKL